MNLDCLLCGSSGPQVRPRMVEWAEPLSKRFEVIPCCVDVQDCRRRAEQQGDVWPLVPTSRETKESVG